MRATLRFPKHQRVHAAWQSKFLEMLPSIEAGLSRAFWYLPAEARDDAVGEGVATCLHMYARVHARGRADLVTAGSLVRLAARRVRAGRGVGRQMNSRDVLSQGVPVQRHELGAVVYRNGVSADWLEAVVATRHGSIPERVALRIDVPQWLRRLSRRMQRIAKDLAIGCTTGEVAGKYGLSAGRISQIRKELYVSWKDFQQGDA